MGSKRVKHNKKRNTAFLYEILNRELAKCMLAKDDYWQKHVLGMIQEHFKKGTQLYKELELYRAIYETAGLDEKTAEKLLEKVIAEHGRLIDPSGLFGEQSKLIGRINKELSPQVFANFVPNYKSLATISQIFSDETPIKRRVILEEGVVNGLREEKKELSQQMEDVDNLVYKTFVEKFNSVYGGENLLEEQRKLLMNYVFSFSDNGISLKSFLNEELKRLRDGVKGSMTLNEMQEDQHMQDSAKKVLEILDEFKRKPINEKMLNKVFQIQELVHEFTSEDKE